MRPQFFDLANTSAAKNLLWYFGLHWAHTRFSFNPQFQSFKLLLGHALQSHRCGQIQSGNVFHFVAGCYLATEFLYFWVSAHFQKHFIRIGDGQSLFNQAMLNQNAMIRRYCQGRWMGLRSALVLSWVFHCTMLTCFLRQKEDSHRRQILMWLYLGGHKKKGAS